MPSGKTTLTLHVDKISCIGAKQYNDSGGTNPNFVLGIFPESVSQVISRIASETPRSGLTGNDGIKTWVFWILKCRFISKFNHCMFHSIERCYPQSSMVHYCRIPKTWSYIYICDCFKTNMLFNNVQQTSPSLPHFNWWNLFAAQLQTLGWSTRSTSYKVLPRSVWSPLTVDIWGFPWTNWGNLTLGFNTKMV